MSLPPPESFSWIEPNVLAAMAWPRDFRRTLEFLREAEIEVIISLTESPLNPAPLEEFGFEYHHLPVEDFAAPDDALIARFVDLVEASRKAGKRAVAHCMAGLGRTGTLAACYLVSRGRTAREAIREVRALRPGSIETSEQEEAVHRFADRYPQAP